MGCFSWMFCDKKNKKPLNMGKVGYLLCPDGQAIKTDDYDGYGHFGKDDSIDVYDCVANWNRAWLIQHPEYEVPQHTRRYDEAKKDWIYDPPKKVSDFVWWPVYSDISMSPKDIETYMHEMTGTRYWEYRWLGIEIACYEDQNEKLPFPIKIASKPVPYNSVPPSVGDPNQGMGDEWY